MLFYSKNTPRKMFPKFFKKKGLGKWTKGREM